MSDETKATRPNLEEIRKRCEAATEGPWFAGYPNAGIIHELDGVWTKSKDLIADQTEKDDALFIAHSRTDIPDLLAYIETLEASLKEAWEVIGFYGDVNNWESGKGKIFNHIRNDTELVGLHINDSICFAGKKARKWLSNSVEYLEQERGRASKPTLK